MTARDSTTPPVITVGSRVRVSIPDSTDSPSSGNEANTGVVIEDYADMVLDTDTDTVGRSWARVHRWAIALDDGRLVFANDDDLTAKNSAPS